MCRHPLEQDRGSRLGIDAVGQGDKSIGGHGGGFGIGADGAGIADPVTHGHLRHPISQCDHSTGALYARRTRQVDGVQAFTMVGVDVVEADRLQAYHRLTRSRRRLRRVLVGENLGPAVLVEAGCFHREVSSA